jgi:hypothetical protein
MDGRSFSKKSFFSSASIGGTEVPDGSVRFEVITMQFRYLSNKVLENVSSYILSIRLETWLKVNEKRVLTNTFVLYPNISSASHLASSLWPMADNSKVVKFPVDP